MPKTWGRLVSATLSESSKLASISERSALVYCLTLPHHDGEGRIPVDNVSLIDLCGRVAIVRRWSAALMAKSREEIRESGLWRVYEPECGGLAAEIMQWWRHQRMDKIKRGSDLMAKGEIPRDARGAIVGSPMGGLTVPTQDATGAPTGGLSVGSEVKLSEAKASEDNSNTRAHAKSNEDAKNGDFSIVRWQPDEIDWAYKAAHQKILGRQGRHSRKDREEFLDVPCPDLDPVPELETFFADVMRSLRAKDLAVTLRSCVNGLSWVPLRNDSASSSTPGHPMYQKAVSPRDKSQA